MANAKKAFKEIRFWWPSAFIFSFIAWFWIFEGKKIKIKYICCYYGFLVFVQCSSLWHVPFFRKILRMIVFCCCCCYCLFVFCFCLSLSSNLSRNHFIDKPKIWYKITKKYIYNEAIDLDALKCCYHWNFSQWKNSIALDEILSCVCERTCVRASVYSFALLHACCNMHSCLKCIFRWYCNKQQWY